MKQKIQKELNDALKYNLSFAGCGFLGIYHGETIELSHLITNDEFKFGPLYSRCRCGLQKVRTAIAPAEDIRSFG